MLTLPPLGDVSRFFGDTFSNDVVIVCKDGKIVCNAVMLSARSGLVEKVFQNTKDTPHLEFSGSLSRLDPCLNLIYGGSVGVSMDNYRSILQVGKMFEITEMIGSVAKWVADELPCDSSSLLSRLITR